MSLTTATTNSPDSRSNQAALAHGHGFKAAYDLALDKLTDARLSPHPLAIGKVILKCSLMVGQLKAVIPSLNYFTRATGIAESHVCDALTELELRNMFFTDPPGPKQKGVKLYWVNSLFDSWRLKERKLKCQPNLPLVMDQLKMEFDKWVTERGPLSDSLLENFVETAGAAVETLTNLCGGLKPPAVSERPVAEGNFGDGKKNPGLVNPGAGSDGSLGRPAAVTTQSLAAGHYSDGKTLAAVTASTQGKKSTPLKKSADAWTWLVIVDNSGPVPKLAQPWCAEQWQRLCMRDPEYVLEWLVSCWRNRCQRDADEDPIKNPLSYLARVALGDDRLIELKTLRSASRAGGG
jgi:hypothetical protein